MKDFDADIYTAVQKLSDQTFSNVCKCCVSSLTRSYFLLKVITPPDKIVFTFTDKIPVSIGTIENNLISLYFYLRLISSSDVEAFSSPLASSTWLFLVKDFLY